MTNTKQHIGIYGVAGPRTLLCCYAVADLEAARQAISDGGGQPGEVQQFHRHRARRHRPAGHGVRRVPAHRRPDPAEAQRRRAWELSYITYEVTDSAAFKSFFSRVLYWTFEPGHIEDGWQVEGTHPMAGVAGGSSSPVTVPMWTVADIDAAVTRVRAAGGTVIQEPTQQPYGLMAECTDDQGGRFHLGQF